MTELTLLVGPFEPEEKPVRPGVYKTILIYRGVSYGDAGFSLWTGERWMDSAPSPREAQVTPHVGSQNKRWWGLPSESTQSSKEQ